MATSNRGWLLLALALVVATAGCADGDIDDPDGPSSVLEIVALQNQPVSCSVQNGFCQNDSAQSCTSSAGCVINQVDLGPCIVTTTLVVQPWTGSVRNVPVSTLGETIPFNDITLNNVLIQYDWIGLGCTTPPSVVGLGGVTIPAGGTGAFTFHPISLQDVGDPCLPLTGHTANLTLTFNAETATAAVSETVTRQLFVQTCSGLGGP